jgi:hypothetical protein
MKVADDWTLLRFKVCIRGFVICFAPRTVLLTYSLFTDRARCIATRIWENGLQTANAQLQLEALSALVKNLYRTKIEATRRQGAEAVASSISPDFVAKAVLHALTLPNPQARYVVGMDASIITLLVRLLPTKVLDYVVRRLV